MIQIIAIVQVSELRERIMKNTFKIGLGLASAALALSLSLSAQAKDWKTVTIAMEGAY